MSQKILLLLQFLLASSRTTVYTPTAVINKNIDPGGRGPFNLRFANQFKRIARVKLRVFILKVAN